MPVWNPCTNTSSPGEKSGTPDATTQPTASMPAIRGNSVMIFASPRIERQSLKLTPAYRVRTITSPSVSWAMLLASMPEATCLSARRVTKARKVSGIDTLDMDTPSDYALCAKFVELLACQAQLRIDLGVVFAHGGARSGCRHIAPDDARNHAGRGQRAVVRVGEADNGVSRLKMRIRLDVFDVIYLAEGDLEGLQPRADLFEGALREPPGQQAIEFLHVLDALGQRPEARIVNPFRMPQRVAQAFVDGLRGRHERKVNPVIASVHVRRRSVGGEIADGVA